MKLGLRTRLQTGEQGQGLSLAEDLHHNQDLENILDFAGNPGEFGIALNLQEVLYVLALSLILII